MGPDSVLTTRITLSYDDDVTARLGVWDGATPSGNNRQPRPALATEHATSYYKAVRIG